MFARSMFRCARTGAPVGQPVRRYATEGNSSGGGFITPIAWSAIAVGVIGGGAYYYTNWQGRQMEKADSAPSEPQFKGGEQGFLSLKLEDVQPLSHNTKKFRFAFEDPKMSSGLPVASAVVTKYQGPEMEKPVIRPYTPTSDVDQKGTVDFVIKKYPNGPMTTHMHDMAPGQRLDIKGPIVKYPIDQSNKHNHIAMISGGTGITPMYQVIRQLFKDPNDRTKVTLVFGNISEDDILLKRELHELENTYPQRFRAFYTLDKPPEGWTQGKGFITKDLLKTVLPEPKEDNIKIFVCGPPGLYKAISGGKNSPTDQGELTGALKELGYSKDQVFKF